MNGGYYRSIVQWTVDVAIAWRPLAVFSCVESLACTSQIMETVITVSLLFQDVWFIS